MAAHLGLGLIPSCQNRTDFIFREGECAVQAAVRDRELRQLRAGDVVNPVAIHRDQDCVALHGVRGCEAGLKGAWDTAPRCSRRAEEARPGEPPGGGSLRRVAFESIHACTGAPLRACLSGPVADPYLIPQ